MTLYRNIENYSLYGISRDTSGWSSESSFVSERIYKELITGASGNYGYPDFPFARNVGQGFYLTQNSDLYGRAECGKIWGTGPYRNSSYEGALRCEVGRGGLYPGWGDYTGASLAAAAYNKMKPTKPDFQALNAIYELREVPSLLRARFHHNDMKNIANWHLALQFGWLPLLRDTLNAINLQRKMQKRLAQLLRDNGKPVRRKVILRDETTAPSTTVDGEDWSAFLPYLVTYFYAAAPRRRQVEYERDRVWAAARFRYWLPPGPKDIRWTRNMIARIYGFQVTPQVVYNAIPWSWLVDWFSNAGDVIANLDVGVADRLAADYFYIMRQVHYVRQSTSTGWFFRQNGEVVKVSGTSYATATVSTRGVGDPFGWATPENNLSATQLSILGALGMSRLR
jgi:hypothetical protein